MPVTVQRHPNMSIKDGNMTEYSLIYREAFDKPTKECELQWRAFETKFFIECCRALDPTRLESEVFLARAEVIQLPNSKIWTWEIGYRFTVVLITDAELSWLVNEGGDMVGSPTPAPAL
jgi:hypothetical protein